MKTTPEQRAAWARLAGPEGEHYTKFSSKTVHALLSDLEDAEAKNATLRLRVEELERKRAFTLNVLEQVENRSSASEAEVVSLRQHLAAMCGEFRGTTFHMAARHILPRSHC